MSSLRVTILHALPPRVQESGRIARPPTYFRFLHA